MGARRGRLRIGTSGYQYDHWRGLFYPPALPRRLWLRHYGASFASVEIDATFYRLPESHVFAAWREQVPRHFRFALKFSRYGSHLKRLREAEATIGHFFERARALGRSLGPVLVQLPPRFGADPRRLDAFLDHWPRDVRCAVEFRDPSWLCEEVFAVLRGHAAALCVHDLLEGHPRVDTARFVYQRFHGVDHAGRYAPQRLVAEARRIRGALQAGRDVYAFFNNDAGGAAPADARALQRYVDR